MQGDVGCQAAAAIMQRGMPCCRHGKCTAKTAGSGQHTASPRAKPQTQRRGPPPHACTQTVWGPAVRHSSHKLPPMHQG